MDRGAFYETAKALAVVDVPIAHPENTVEETIERILGKKYVSASHIVVLEGGKLVGIVTAEDLFSAGPEDRIGGIMDSDPPRVSPDTDQEVVAWQAVQKGEYAMPVVDHYGYFLGLIPPFTLLRVLLQEHEEDLSKMAGILGPDNMAVSYGSADLGRRVLYRLPWLLAGLVGGFLAAGVVGMFEKELERHVALAFFIPTVVYLADAVGTQTEALIVRALALRIPVDIGRETKTSSAIGLALFFFSFFAVSIFWKDMKIALVVSLAILLASTAAGFVASLLPMFLKRLGSDPAHGSGPLATVLQDIISVFVYFLVASLLL
ncbi:MAG: magnesium transporter [Aquificaceae bacterium]|jgi:magnesium transporter|uniref:magnesium transporter n=1 Tax=Hydrogenobacter sp. Uz 6-8 TaxID=3384828 RepID=UPI0030A9695E